MLGLQISILLPGDFTPGHANIDLNMTCDCS